MLEIDLNRTYTGDEVNNIINIILEEADKSIENAYKEGYKLAAIEYEPKIDYYKTLYNETIKYNKIDIFKNVGIGLGCGILLTLTAGSITYLSIKYGI